MIDDPLPALWTADEPIAADAVKTAIHAALAEDRAARDKDRSVRAGSIAAVALLCPVLVWSAAHGVTPLVRGGYALMAVGTAIMIAAEWLYLAWSREAMPGPADARSQLQKSAFLLSRQAHLMRTGPLWCSPVFLGTALIAGWLFQQRSHAGGYLLWGFVAAGWLLTLFGGRSKAAALDAQRQRLEHLLGDLG
jgi:hypothetical protein